MIDTLTDAFCLLVNFEEVVGFDLEDSCIAVTNLFDCMLTAISFGIPPETAIAAATMNPAKSIGIYDTVGSLTVGKKADVLIVNQEYELIRVI